MTQQVIFSDRAYIALMTETLSKIKTETGGIFLGHFYNDKWYIIESIDPGPSSTFSPAYFEYDEAYVNHLVNKINILYETPLRLIGLWHRHPGSMDSFSSTDNETHAKFAGINPYGVISALVNIDPAFRITIYSIKTGSTVRGQLTISKMLTSYLVGNEHIPENLFSLALRKKLETKINNSANIRTEQGNKSKLFNSIIKKTLEAHDEIRNTAPIPVLDDDIEKVIEAFESDIDFFEKQGISCAMSRTKDGALFLYENSKAEKKQGIIEIFMIKGKIYIRCNKKTVLYTSGLFGGIA